jgi:hypothetical protein
MAGHVTIKLDALEVWWINKLPISAYDLYWMSAQTTLDDSHTKGSGMADPQNSSTGIYNAHKCA